MLNNCLLENTAPLIVDSIRFFKGKACDYSHYIEKMLIFLLDYNIKVSTIVSDNLRAQVSAIDYKNKNLIQKKSINPAITKILWLSCSCHFLALGLSDSKKACNYGSLVQQLITAANFFRCKNIVNLLEIKCPIACQTRWTGI